MIQFNEGKANQSLIVVEILPFIDKYKKPSATSEDVNSLAQQVSCVLDLWDYSHKEIRVLDRKAFMDLMKSYYQYLKDPAGKSLFARVFDF